MDSKMKMVKGKDGKMVPSFAADGRGRMNGGGMVDGDKTKKTPDKKVFFEFFSASRLGAVRGSPTP